MSKRKDKATKLLDAYERAVRRHAHRGERPIDEFDDIDEELFMARTKLQYHIEWLNKEVGRLQRALDQAKELIPE